MAGESRHTIRRESHENHGRDARATLTSQIAPSSRHLGIDDVSAQNHECRKGKTSRQLIGAPAGIRTPNQQIMSLLL